MENNILSPTTFLSDIAFASIDNQPNTTDDDIPENPTQEDFERVVPTEEELNSPLMDALVEHLLNGGTLPNPWSNE